MPEGASAARGARLVGRALLWVGLLGLLASLVLASTGASRATAQEGAGTGGSGEILYEQHCVTCHGPQGEGTFRGPTLQGAGAASADFYLRSGRMPIDEPDEEVERSEPHFDEAQIRALVDLVAGFGDGPPIPDVDVASGEVARGGEVFRLNCAACHNWDAQGGALVHRENAPPLHDVPPRQAAEAIRIGPGTMPEFDETVLPEEELNSVLAYLELLQEPPDRGGYGLGHWGPATEMLAAFVALGVMLVFTGWLGERR